MRLLCLCLLPLIIATAHADGSAMRVLIDVSGSMQRNDPGNLRVPALKLLLELLPAGIRTGVWLFDGSTEALIPPAPVDPAWRESALQASHRIHSRGRYTDLEQALETVTADWQAPQEGRHILLLTDGKVDVSPDPAADAASADRIRQRLIPRLQKLGVHVYPIALSDQADHELLEHLAVATDGWQETAQSAEQLQRTFTRILTKAVPRDRLPLQEGGFTVDTSVREFSLLVFRQPGSPATELVRPDGSRWSNADHPEAVRWLHTDSFDLITVSEPIPGRWQLVAQVDPDNQVMIVTDLRLKVVPLPNYLLAGEAHPVRAELTEGETRITRQSFLRLVQFQLRQTGPAEAHWSLAPDPDDAGALTRMVPNPGKPGTYTFTLTADGKTFQRTWEQRVRILASPVTAEVIRPATADGAVLIRLTPDPALIDPASFRAKALISTDGEPLREEAFNPAAAGRWELPITAPGDDRHRTINLDVQAQTPGGQTIPVVLKPVVLDPQWFQPEVPATTPEEEAVLVEAPPAPDWLSTTLAAVGINLVLGAAGLLGWHRFRRHVCQQQERLLSRFAD